MIFCETCGTNINKSPVFVNSFKLCGPCSKELAARVETETVYHTTKKLQTVISVMRAEKIPTVRYPVVVDVDVHNALKQRAITDNCSLRKVYNDALKYYIANK